MRRWFVYAAVPLALLAGCAQGGPGSSDPGGQPPGGTSAAFDRRAVEVAKAWRASGSSESWRHGFVPLGDLTVLPPDARFSDDTKLAFGNGWFRSTVPLPADVPADGTVRFSGAETLSVPLTSAAEAYRAIDKGDPPCSAESGSSVGGVPPAVQTAGPENPSGTKSTVLPAPCTSLTVTGVKLGTVQLRTSRGEATVPAWLFTVDELAGALARVAVAPAAIGAVPSSSPPPFQPDSTLVGAQDLAKVDGPELAYRLLVGACDKDITPLAYEAEDVVVVGGQVTRSAGACVAMAKIVPVTVTLDTPLGDRLVLDVGTGAPLLLTP
jgi:hypothetical protein